jgi:hypothetical protein
MRGKRARTSRPTAAIAGALVVGLAGALGAIGAGLGCGFDGLASGGVGGAGTDGSAVPTGADASGTDASGSSDGSSVLLDASSIDAPVEAGCGDVLSAPLNCGRCGHSCLGGACAAGKCQPLTIATDPGLGAVTVDATNVYFVAENAGVLRKIPLAGGAPVALYNTGRAPHDLAIAGTSLYWTDQFSAGGYSIPLNAANTVGGGADAARAVTLTPNGPHFIRTSTVELFDLTLTQSLAAFTNTGASPAIVSDATYTYWAAGKQIRRVQRPTTSVTNVVTGLAEDPTALAISATHVYWATPTSVQRAPIGIASGWTIATITSATETAAASIAVDATDVYWLDLTTGALRRAPITGGTPETLATFTKQLVDAPYPHQIALTADAIYVASTSDGTLSRLAK